MLRYRAYLPLSFVVTAMLIGVALGCNNFSDGRASSTWLGVALVHSTGLLRSVGLHHCGLGQMQHARDMTYSPHSVVSS